MTIYLDPPRHILILTAPIRPPRVDRAAVRELAAVIDHAWERQMRGGVSRAGLYEESEKRA